jgi:holo-[acyl-carrier protein] synthase
LIATGVDILEVARVDRAILRHAERFFDRFFTPQELIDCAGHTPALAARLAGKEAVAKALGTGIGKVGWKDIEIVHGPMRRPILLVVWSVSLSHTHEHAMAVAVASGEGA